MIDSAHNDMDSLRLPKGEVHLWYDVVEDRPVEDLSTARGVVDPEGSEGCCDRPTDRLRRECLAAYSMLRNVLSQYAPTVAPAEWRFHNDADGREVVTGPAGQCELHVNLSFADGIAACVVSGHYDVGVEVGRVGRQPEHSALSSLGSAREAARPDVLPADQSRRLLESRALREAFNKARGRSRPVAPHALSFDVSRPGRPRVTFAPGFDDDEAAWQFDRLFVGTEHVVALATRRGFTPAIAVVVRAFENVPR